MPKLKNVTIDELLKASELAQDAGSEVSHLVQRADAGYCDEVPSPIQLASAFMGAADAMMSMARLLIIKASLQEQRREIEAKLRDKQKG